MFYLELISSQSDDEMSMPLNSTGCHLNLLAAAEDSLAPLKRAKCRLIPYTTTDSESQ